MTASAIPQRRKGLLSGVNLKINTAAVVAAVVLVLVGMFAGALLGDWLFGYGAIGSMEVVISDSSNGAVPFSLGTFQVHEVSSWFGMEGNHILFTVTQRPLQ